MKSMPDLSEVTAPRARTGAQRQAVYRETDGGRARNRAWQSTEKGREKDAREKERAYLSRPFLAWDGEGVTVDGEHRYVLLANSVGGSLVNKAGLSTGEIFDFLLESKRANPKAIHIIYGGGYDFNFWMRSLSRDDVLRVYRHESVSRQAGVRIGKYRVWWRRGKYFRVASGSTSVTVYDVLSFFQRSFVKACDEYLGERFEYRDQIVEQKLRRAAFGIEELPEIAEYNRAELRNLVLLAAELRKRLNKVGLRPGRWDGPGAIAATLMSRKGIKGAKSERNENATPEGVLSAIRFAYAGGRFECVKFGDTQLPAYEYDINSAYPHALRRVPCLAHGRWIRHDGNPGCREFALYHVRYSGPQGQQPAPLYRRNSRGAIAYPGTVSGWYWSPEIDATREHVKVTGRGALEVVECWEYVPDTQGCRDAGHDPEPFSWIEGYYRERQALKAVGDGAHVGIKLALNSLYGKLAQQVGWYRDATGRLRLPPFHELAWAGYVTSTCRAMVLRAVLSDLDSVIAFETDAVFTTCPLPVTIGSGLGEWEETAFSSLAYVQSGTYFGTKVSGDEVVRTRGVDLGTLTRAQVSVALSSPRADGRCMDAQLTRFVGAGLALAQDWSRWCTWQKTPKRISAEPPEGSKRSHDWCPNCWTERELKAAKRRGQPLGYRLGVWHDTCCEWDSRAGFRYSCEFPIAWVNPDPEMVALEEFREMNYEQWDGME